MLRNNVKDRRKKYKGLEEGKRDGEREREGEKGRERDSFMSDAFVERAPRRTATRLKGQRDSSKPRSRGARN